MTLAESIISLISAIVTILGGMAIFARYLVKRLDKWANALVDNSEAMRKLTARVDVLERTIKNV